MEWIELSSLAYPEFGVPVLVTDGLDADIAELDSVTTHARVTLFNFLQGGRKPKSLHYSPTHYMLLPPPPDEKKETP
jgi:hypothetical protein